MPSFRELREMQKHKEQMDKITKNREKRGLDDTIDRMGLEGEWVEMARKHQAIDEQWSIVKSSSDSMKMHSGERRMLYDLLDDGERLEGLVGGTFRKDTDRLHKHSGVAVATDKRILFLDHGILGSTETMEIGYRHIESVTHSTGMVMAGIQVVGRGASSYRIEDIANKAGVAPFVAGIRSHMEEFDSGDSPAPAAAAVGGVAELETLAGLLERGILTQAEFDAKKKQILGL